MPKKRFSPEQVIAKLRQIEVQLAQGKSIALACKDAAISEQSSSRVPEAGDLLQPQGSSGRHRRLARSRQPGAAPLISGLSATRTDDHGGHRTAATHIPHHAVDSQCTWSKIPVRSQRTSGRIRHSHAVPHIARDQHPALRMSAPRIRVCFLNC